MPYTERSKPQVILNKMTKAVYDSIEKDPDQLYAVTDAEVYSLPTASANTLGGIKVGNNLSITEDGTLSAEAGGDAVYDTNGVNITDTTGTRVKIGSGANTYGNGVAIGVSAKAGTSTTQRRSIAIGNEAQAGAADAIAIGPSSIAAKAQAVSIGNGANSQGAGATAIGQNAYVYGSNSVALGTNSYAEYADTVAVGDPGYEPDGIPAYYRKITCVEDGTDAHDAATVGQMPKERSLTQAEYNALSDAEKNNGTTYYITDASNRQNDVYSTSEQAVGTWIDGRTVYRKSAAFLNVQATANGYKLFDFAPAKSMPLDIKVTYNASWDKGATFFTHDALSQSDVRWFMANGQLRVNWGGNAWSGDYYVTVDYVKN